MSILGCQKDHSGILILNNSKSISKMMIEVYFIFLKAIEHFKLCKSLLINQKSISPSLLMVMWVVCINWCSVGQSGVIFVIGTLLLDLSQETWSLIFMLQQIRKQYRNHPLIRTLYTLHSISTSSKISILDCSTSPPISA